MYETLLFLHVLGAFLLVAMLGLYWAMYLVGPAGSISRLGGVAMPLWGVGSISVLVFGLWLSFDVSRYNPWDGWIVVAIVLWFVQGAFGSKLSQGYKRAASGATDRPPLSAHVIATGAVLLLLIDMVWKPGAFPVIRPDSWDLPLFVHVAGAMAVTAAVVIAAAALVLAWRAAGEQRDALTRFAFRTLLFGGVPAWIVMRIGAQWIYRREPYTGDNDPTWIGIGFSIAEPSGILILLATILTWLGVRRMRAGRGGGGLAKAGTVLATIAVALYAIAIWAMTTKPS
jgi:hypothetical protein